MLDDLSGGFRENVPAGADFVQGSITDAALVDALFARERLRPRLSPCRLRRRGPEPFHQALQLHQQRDRQRQPDQRRRSTTASRAFVFTSSIAVYGASPELPMTEETPARPEDPYGIAKYAVEQDLHACRDMFGLDFIVFRPHNVYRPAAEYRRPLSQRRRHLHEPDPAGPSDDDLRRRHANARVQLHRRCGADHGGGDRRAGGVEPGVQHRRRSALHAQRARRSRRRRDGGRAPNVVHLPARGEVAARARVARQGAARVWRAPADLARRRPCAHGRVGPRTRRPRQRAVSRRSRSRATCRPHG